MRSSIPSVVLDNINQALEGEQFAEEIYSKFYFESRRAPYAELAAEARLTHTIAATTLKKAIQKIGGSPSAETPMIGPFSGDPRAAISGIDPLFLVDYLRESEHRNLKVYERLLACPDLPDEIKDELTNQAVVRLANLAVQISRLSQTIQDGGQPLPKAVAEEEPAVNERDCASTA